MSDLTTALNIFAIGLLVVCLGLWVCGWWFGPRFPPRRWLQPSPSTPLAVWGLIDLFVIFVIYVLFELGAVVLLTSGTPGSPANQKEDESKPSPTSSSLVKTETAIGISSVENQDGPAGMDGLGEAETSPSDADTRESPDADQSGSEPDDAEQQGSTSDDVEDDDSQDNAADEGQTDPATTANRSATAMATVGTARLLSLVAMLGWMVVRYRTSSRELGVVPNLFLNDILLGLTASLMLLPLVIGLQSLLTLLIRYEHSTMTQVVNHQSGAVIAAAFLSAGIAAPFLEEYLYRVFLQGWLDKFMSALWTARNGSGKDLEFEQATWIIGGGRDEEQTIKREQDRAATSKPAATSASATKDSHAERRPWLFRLTPVLLASLLFALAHFGQGPAPISLFFFALGVGSLFAVTQRALPCIVVHLVLNFWSLTILTIGILSGATSGS